MTFKDSFPGLSRTLSFNFKEKILDFPGGVGNCITHCSAYQINIKNIFNASNKYSDVMCSGSE